MTGHDAPAPGVTRRIVDTNVAMTTRDGVVLRAVVHREADRAEQPIVLVRNPYGEPLTRSLPIVALLAAGFAILIQDCRGTGASDGDYAPLEHEIDDSADAIAWAAALPFSNGRVVTYGHSYLGMVQMAGATTKPDALAGMIPVVTPADYQTGLAYRGGAFQLGQEVGWYTMASMLHLLRLARRGEDVSAAMAALAAHATDPYGSVTGGRLVDAPGLTEVLSTWRSWLERDEEGDYWPSIGYRDRRDQIEVPALHVGGWFDLFLGGTIDNFATLRAGASGELAREGQRLIVGPWQHTDQSGVVGERTFEGPASAVAFGLERIVAEFAHAAATGAEIPGPRIRLYVMNAGRWRDADTWPVEGTAHTPWYLQPGGGLAPERPTAAQAESVFVHDPADPVPMHGGQSGIAAGGREGGVEWTAGPRDQRPLDGRDDVLRFTGEPLAEDVEVTGPVEVVLHASTSAADTDFVARLIDVHPDGRAMGVVDGIVRAKFRDGQTVASPIVPGEVVEYRIDLWATSWLFKAGHRIRIDVASSSYPNWEPNPGVLGNTAFVEPADRVTAEQRVQHSATSASHVVLPIVPVPVGRG